MSYVNGSNMLLYVGGKAIGHCTTHTCTMNSETKERAVKPAASVTSLVTGLYKEKGITGLSISLSAEGLAFNGETESGYAALFAAWKAGESVVCKCMARGVDPSPYLEGKFVIASLERTDPAQDDSTYSVSLENDGEPTVLDATVFSE